MSNEQLENGSPLTTFGVLKGEIGENPQKENGIFFGEIYITRTRPRLTD